MAGYTSSSSSTTSTPVQTPQSIFALSVAQAAAGVGSYLVNWAQQVYAQTSAITNQMVNDFLTTSQYGMSLAKTQLTQYEGTTVPEMQQLANEAGDYSSTPRIQYNMGAAESYANQAAGAANTNTLQNLRSYGVDPSSGMYGDILAAQNTAAGAAEAGAAQQAQINTENTGRTLLNQSIAAGQTLPGDTVNALNSAYQGVSGAENSVLSNANTGATVMNTAAPFYSAAIGLKYPTNATVSKTGSSGGGGGGGGNSNQSSLGKYGNLGNNAAIDASMNGSGRAPPGSTGFPGGGAGSAPGAPGAGVPDGSLAAADMGQANIPGGAEGLNPSGGGFNDFGNGAYGGVTNLANDPVNQQFTSYDGSTSNPFTSDQGPSDGGFAGAGLDSSGGVQSYNADPGNGWGDFSQPAATDWSGGASNLGFDASTSGSGGFSGGLSNYGGGGAGDQGPTQFGGYSQISENNGGQYMSGGYSGGGGGFGGGGYAAGGQVQRNFRPPMNRGVLPTNATTGGQVPQHASPSGGRQTDDVAARLNAGEFVIPKDVAAWKGHEFFQKLIAQSRKARVTGSPAQGQMKPPLSGPPRFVSHGAIGAQHGR